MCGEQQPGVWCTSVGLAAADRHIRFLVESKRVTASEKQSGAAHCRSDGGGRVCGGEALPHAVQLCGGRLRFTAPAACGYKAQFKAEGLLPWTVE